MKGLVAGHLFGTRARAFVSVCVVYLSFTDSAAPRYLLVLSVQTHTLSHDYYIEGAFVCKTINAN